MVTQICERVRGSEATELHRGLQSDGGLRADAEGEGIGGRSCTEDEWNRKRASAATDNLLDLLKIHHPSHAPVAVLMGQKIENPAPSVVINNVPPTIGAVAGSGAEACGAPLAPEEFPESRPKVIDIQRVVARRYDVTRDDILSSRRTAVVTWPRQVAMYLAKILTLQSLPEIGRRFGGRDHTTVLHAVRKVANKVQSDPGLAADIGALRALLEVRATCPHCHQLVPA